MREIERVVLLKMVDQKWMDNIDDMAQLRQGIGLQSMGGRDPVVEYKLAGYDMFNAMLESIKEDTSRFIMHIAVRREEDQQPGPGGKRVHRGPASPSAPGADEEAEHMNPGDIDREENPDRESSRGPADEMDSEGPGEDISEGPSSPEEEARMRSAAAQKKASHALQQITRREEVAKVTGTNRDETKKKEPVKRKGKKIMPNDPCPCGSGKKYKLCCGRK